MAAHFLIRSLSVLGVVVGMAGCGPVEREVDSVSNYLNGAPCGIEPVGDYNRFAGNCSATAVCANCVSSGRSLLAKYPGINCQATTSSTSSVNDNVIVITDAYVRQQVTRVGCGTL